MAVMQEETFGPVVPVMPFDTEDDAIRLANDTPYGLGASVWTRDQRRARRIARRLATGMVWINDHASSIGAAQAPWAGVKGSGFGVVHSKFGLYEMVDKRLLSEDRGLLPVPWWYPYDEAGRAGFMALVRRRSRPVFGASSRRAGLAGEPSSASAAASSDAAPGPDRRPPRRRERAVDPPVRDQAGYSTTYGSGTGAPSKMMPRTSTMQPGAPHRSPPDRNEALVAARPDEDPHGRVEP